MNRRLMLTKMLAGGAAASAVAVLATPTFASASWCDDDPLVTITTPTGVVLPVHLTNSAMAGHQDALQVVHNNPNPPYITWTVEPSSGKGKAKHVGGDVQEWNVSIWVLIPGKSVPSGANGERFQVKCVASTEPNGTGKILALDHGWCDKLMQLRFSIMA
jgi:hypothetical protein